MTILVAYSTDTSVAQATRKGNFDEMKRQVESYASLGDVCLITQDTRNYGTFFRSVRHLACGFNLPPPLNWLLFYLKSLLVLEGMSSRVDAVRAYGIGNLMPATVCRVHRIPLVVSYEYDWSGEMLLTRRRLLHAVSRKIEDLVFEFSTVTVGLSRRLCDEASKRGAKNVVLIPNGIDPNLVRELSNEEKERIRSHLGLVGKKIVLYVGRLHSIKGVPYLIKAVSHLHQRHDDIGLLVVGDGADREKLRLLCEKVGLTDHTVFTGFVPRSNVFSFMKVADVLVLPSLMEGNPRVLIEAMFCRLPIVGTDVAGVRDLIEQGRNGLLVSPRNPIALAQAVDSILGDAYLARKLIEEAYRDASRRFNGQKLVDMNVGLVSCLVRAARGADLESKRSHSLP